MAQRDQFSDFDDDLAGQPDPVILNEGNESREESPPEDIARLRQERDAALEMREEAIRSMLDQGRQAQRTEEPETAPVSEDDFIRRNLPEDVDEDVVALLTPVLRAQKKLIEEDVAQRYGHVAETVERQENLKVIGQRVEGFNEELVPEIQKLYNKLPQDEQAEYDNRLGFEVLARRVLSEKRGSADMSGMAHSADPAAPQMRDPGAGPTEADVWALSDEQFDAMVHKIKMKPSR